MVANDRPKRRNAGSNLNQLILKEKENDGVNVPVDNDEEEPSIDFYNTPESSNDKDDSNKEQDKQNVIPEDNDEEEPIIDFYNTPELLNDKDNSNKTTESLGSKNHADFATQTNDMNLMLNSFVKRDYFEDFYNEYLEFKYNVHSILDQQLDNTSNSENETLKKKIIHLEQEIINLKKVNEDLKNDTKSHLKIIENLSEGKSIDNPWQATSSKRNPNRITTPTHLTADNNSNNKYYHKNGSTIEIALHNNPYDILYVENNNIENLEEEEEVTFNNTGSRKRKPRSNRINRVPIRNEQIYNNNCDMNNSQRVVPGNRTYASATKYGKKTVLIGDSHLRRINRRLFNDALPNCKGTIKYLSGAKTLDLEHYMKPTLNNYRPDAIIIYIGSNDINLGNFSCDTAVDDIAEKIIKVALLCKEYGVNEIAVSSILPKGNIKLSKLIRQVNDRLYDLCSESNVYFLTNDNINRSFICDDGLHLNKKRHTYFS